MRRRIGRRAEAGKISLQGASISGIMNMPTHVHEFELIGGPLDGCSWEVLVGQRPIDVPIDRRSVDDFTPVKHWTHRYELQVDGRYQYAGGDEGE